MHFSLKIRHLVTRIWESTARF